jgi:outer membrane protein OmpA-like peptidoglycan-associated protein
MEMTMMFSRENFVTRVLTAACLAGGIALAIAPGSAMADEQAVQKMIDDLKVSKSRGIGDSGAPSLSPGEHAFVKRMQGQSRSLSPENRDQMAGIVSKSKSVDLNVNFEFNSASLTPSVEPQLNDLGKVLTSPELAGSVIMLGGHTDAKGSDPYNQGLSERRAETVKRFLIEKYHIPAARLLSAGYGKRDLKNTADPFAAENRRVQIANVDHDEAAK